MVWTWKSVNCRIKLHCKQELTMAFGKQTKHCPYLLCCKGPIIFWLQYIHLNWVEFSHTTIIQSNLADCVGLGVTNYLYVCSCIAITHGGKLYNSMGVMHLNGEKVQFELSCAVIDPSCDFMSQFWKLQYKLNWLTFVNVFQYTAVFVKCVFKMFSTKQYSMTRRLISVCLQLLN